MTDTFIDTNVLIDNEKGKDLSRFLDISINMIQKVDLVSLLSFIMEEATRTMQADRSTLYLIDRERSELVSFIAQRSEIKEIRLPMGMGIAGYVAETGKMVNIESAYKNPLFDKEADIQTGYITRTVLCVPMKNREGEIVGVLQVLNKKTGLFTEYDEWLFKTYAAYAVTAIENARLHEEREKTFLSTIRALAAAIDRRDPVTAGHSERVARLSVDIGKTLGLAKNDLKMLNYAATLHDVGKIGVRDKVLLKPDKLTSEERNEMIRHSQYTKEILEEVYFTKEYKNIPAIAAMHHERVDGSGYPYGLKAEQLNIFGRVIAVADIFDALMSFDRPYKKALSLPETLEIIQNEAEKNHLDPNIVKIFIEKKVYRDTFPGIENPDYCHKR